MAVKIHSMQSRATPPQFPTQTSCSVWLSHASSPGIPRMLPVLELCLHQPHWRSLSGPWMMALILLFSLSTKQAPWALSSCLTGSTLQLPVLTTGAPAPPGPVPSCPVPLPSLPASRVSLHSAMVITLDLLLSSWNILPWWFCSFWPALLRCHPLRLSTFLACLYLFHLCQHLMQLV